MILSSAGNNSSDYDSVRLSDNESDMDDRNIFNQIKIQGKNEIKEYRSFGERVSTFWMNCLNCSFFGDDDFDYESVDVDVEEPEEEHHLKVLEMKPIKKIPLKTPSRSSKKKRHSNNKKPENDVEDPVLIISTPPPDSAREQSSDSDKQQEDNGSDNNDIISLPVPTLKPKTPPNSSASSSSDDSIKELSKQPPTIVHYISAESSSSSDSSSESEEQKNDEENEHMICITSIKPSIVPKAIAYINSQKQEITKLKQEYSKMRNRADLRKNTDEVKSFETKIALILDLLIWCTRSIDDLNTFSKRINNYKNREKVFITYDITQYCDEIRSFLHNKIYIKFLKQEEGFEDLPIIRSLPLIREVQ